MTLPNSLYGYAIELRNLMRGGSSVDGDRYPLRQLAHAIVHETAVQVQQELYDADSRGIDPDPALYIQADEQLHQYGYQPTDRPIVIKKSCAPKTLLWKGEPAIIDFRTGIDGAMFIYRRDSATAILSLTIRVVSLLPSRFITIVSY